MYNHAPNDYQCNLCQFVKGVETEYNKRSDIVYETPEVLAFISPKWWKNNPGNVVIIPKKHFEHIYDIPDDLFAQIAIIGKRLAVAIRTTYNCDGTSLRQHNEPAGNQDVFHYHLHVFPRYDNDDLYLNHKNISWTSPEERLPFANKLKKYFNDNHE